MDRCRRLYLSYKSVCDIVGQKSTVKPINIDEASEDELSKYFSDLMREYSNLNECYEGRVKHRQDCIKEQEYDPGHNYQLNMLQNRMRQTSKLLDKIYDKLEETVTIESIPEKQEESVRATSPSRRTPTRSPTRERQRSKDQILEYIDENIKKEQKLRKDVQHSNLRHIQQMAYADPQIWRSAIPLAIEYDNIRILKEAQNQLRYLNGSSKMKDLEQRIEEYALKNDIPSLLRYPTPPIWFDDPNSYLDDKIRMYTHQGGPKIVEATYRYILEYLKGLPKPITDEQSLNKVVSLRSPHTNKAINDLSNQLLDEITSLQVVQWMLHTTIYLQNPTHITTFIDEYIAQLRKPQFISQFLNDEIENQLNLAAEIKIQMLALALASNEKVKRSMLNMYETYINKQLPLIRVLLLSEQRKRK